uniref:Uncharacterized protein n=1 Tax=Arundo donax TaxID=35708 RepID=A0A0A9HMF5_ARUDO
MIACCPNQIWLLLPIGFKMGLSKGMDLALPNSVSLKNFRNF